MYAIYAFCREVDDIADEPGAIEDKLAALVGWRTEIDRLFEGNPTRSTTRALLPALAAYSLPKKEFLAVIDGMEMDAREAMVAPSLADFELYCRRVAGAVGCLSICAFGATGSDGEQLAVTLGEALQVTNVLRDLDEDAARGRLYLPAAWLPAARSILLRERLSKAVTANSKWSRLSGICAKGCCWRTSATLRSCWAGRRTS